MTADPFAGLATQAAPAKPAKKETPVATTKTTKAAAAPAEPDTNVVIDEDFAAFLESLGGDLEMEFGEEEFAAPVAYRPYMMPPAGEWIPVTIIGIAELELRPMTVVIGEDVNNTREIQMPRLKLEAEHASTVYGNKKYPYNLFVPVFPATLKTRRGDTWRKMSGPKLFAAAKVATKGGKLKFNADNPEAMLASIEAIAEQLLGKTVMARVKHTTKDYTDVIPMVDPVTGEAVYDENGEIRTEVKTTTKTFDNLEEDVAPLPERGIELDGKAYEITLNTIGRITKQPVAVGTLVVAVASDEEEVVARWTANGWVRHQDADGSVLIEGGDIFKGN